MFFSLPASNGEQLHPRPHVLLLRTSRAGSCRVEIPLVEEILDNPSTDPVHHCLNPWHQRHSIGMRLPALDAIRTRHLHGLLHRPVRQLLRESIHRKGNETFTVELSMNSIDI